MTVSVGLDNRPQLRIACGIGEQAYVLAQSIKVYLGARVAAGRCARF
ncbi:MAG: hypothetical protein ACKOXX_04930 [Actinomycetota bacterium]